MAISLFIQFSGYLAEIILQKLVTDYIDIKQKEHHTRKLLEKTIEESLQHTLDLYSNGNFIFENFDFKTFFSSSRVKNELEKLTNPLVDPDLDVLINDFEQISGDLKFDNYKFIISHFIRILKVSLKQIPEFANIFHIKETKEFQNFATQSLIDIRADLNKLTGTNSNFIKEEKEYDSKLDICKDLLKKGNTKAALNELISLDTAFINKEISNEIRAKTRALLGGCYLEMGKEILAADKFIESYYLSPENPKYQANASIGFLIKKDYPKCLEILEKIPIDDANKAHILSIKLLVQADIDHYDSVILEKLVNSDLLMDPEYCRAVAITFSRSKNITLAEEYLRLSLTQNPNDYSIIINLVNILGQKCSFEKAVTIPFIFFDGSQKEYLKESKELINIAIRIAKDGDNRIKVLDAISSRSGISAFSGDISSAKADCDYVLGEDSEHILANHNRALIALVEGDGNLALTHFSKLPDDYISNNQLELAFAQAFIIISQPKKAIDHLRSNESRIHNHYGYLQVLTTAFILNKQFDEAEKIKDSLLREETADSLEVVSNIEYQLGNYDSAIFYLKKILDIIPANKRILNLLAQISYFMKDYKSSISYIDKSQISIIENQDLLTIYVQSLYFIKNYEKAQRIICDSLGLGYSITSLIEIGINIYEILGDIDNALELQNRLCEANPNNLIYIFNLARLNYRKGNIPESINLLNTIDLNSFDYEFELMQIAEIYSREGFFDKALEFAFKSQYVGSHNPEIQRAYIGLILRLEHLESIDIKIVTDNSAVYIRTNSSTYWVKITSIINLDENNFTFPISSGIAAKLIGHKVGDKILIKDSPLEKIDAEIINIQSIFVRAFQEILEFYGIRFPEDTNIQQITIKDEDYSDFYLSVARIGFFQDKVIDIFKMGGLTIEQFARFMGKNQILVFQSMQKMKSDKIYADRGMKIDQDNQRQYLSTSKNITLSISSILTFSYLDELNLLLKRFDSLFIPQLLVDEFNETVDELRKDCEIGKSVIGYHEGRFFIQDSNKDELRSELKAIESIRNFIVQNCTIIPISLDDANFIPNNEDKSLDFGNVSIACILVAKATKSILVSDELVLRDLAFNKYGVSSVWTQPIFFNFIEKGLIDITRLSNNCVLLLEAKYFFTTVTPEIVFQVISDQRYLLNRPVSTIIGALKGPDMIEDDAINIGSKALKRIWLGVAPTQQRVFILDQILGALVEGRDQEIVLKKLGDQLLMDFFLLPFHYLQIKRLVNDWRRVHFSQTPFILKP
jgi:tetratricopeptide (TPR) repeat protein